MISDLTKKRPRREQRALHDQDRQETKGAFQDPTPDVEFVGEELQRFAAARGLDEQDVWTRIRNGELIGRSFGGKLYINEPNEMGELSAAVDELPPLPEEADLADEQHLVPSVPQSTEMALLLDHLSIAKEENREILRLSQDSISRVTHMADTIVAMKDDLLKAKDEQIDGLREKVKSREVEIARLKQELEDLKMLAMTLSQHEPKDAE